MKGEIKMKEKPILNTEKIITDMVKDFFKTAMNKKPKHRWMFNIYCGDNVGVCRDGHIIYYIYNDLFPLDINKYKFVSGRQTDLLKDMYEENHDIYNSDLKALINTNIVKTLKDGTTVNVFEFLGSQERMAINTELLSMFDIKHCLFRAKNNISPLYVYSGNEVLLGAIFPINPKCLED